MVENKEINSMDVASHIAYVCEAMGHEWNNTKIQKLLYIAYGALLATENTRICDEYPRAWKFGPVFPRVFNQIQKGRFAAHEVVNLPEHTKKIIENVVRTYARHTATTLSNWSHQQGSPWDIVVNKHDAPNSFIPDEYIKQYFATNVIRG